MLQHPDALLERLDTLSALMRRRHLWEPRAFILHRLPWEDDHPDLSAWLRRLTTPQILAIEENPFVLQGATPGVYLEWASASQAATAIGAFAQGAKDAAGLEGPHVRFKIPGRKWTQVRSFAQVALWTMPPGATRIVDWCAGKGHLGRALGAATGLPVRLIERQGRLGPLARRLAGRLRLDVEFIEADALDPGAGRHIDADTVAVGLHACGALTSTLLEGACRAGARAVLVAPCCHHFLGPATSFIPMSRAARDADLPLAPHQLRLSIADDVLAPGRDRRRRAREQSWRQGFDLLVREATGREAFTSLGILPPDAPADSFERFCRAMAAQLDLPLPSRWDPDRAEAAGQERARLARALGLVRALFRRPMELWIVLDRALYLTEQGRPAQLGAFCDRADSPRNLLIASCLP